jgi:hypothetical protein
MGKIFLSIFRAVVDGFLGCTGCSSSVTDEETVVKENTPDVITRCAGGYNH